MAWTAAAAAAEGCRIAVRQVVEKAGLTVKDLLERFYTAQGETFSQGGPCCVEACHPE